MKIYITSWMGCPSTYLNYSCQSCRKIEEGPESAEPKLNHEPGNDVEFFHGVNEVHYQKHEAHPKGGHRDKNKPLSYCPLLVVRARAHHTDKTQNVHQLKWRWEHWVTCRKLWCQLTTATTLSAPGKVLTYPGSHLRLTWTWVSLTVVFVWNSITGQFD